MNARKQKSPRRQGMEDLKRETFALDVSSAPRKMELLGVQEGGRLVVWDTGMVQPISQFADPRPSGYYVIDYKGAAVTAHLSVSRPGWLRVQTMGWGVPIYEKPFITVENRLLGKVIPNAAHQAEMARLLNEIAENVSRGLNAPHKQRGRLLGGPD